MYLDSMIEIVRSAGKIILSADLSQASITEKSVSNDLVTSYDIAVQAYLNRELLSLIPGSSFLGEENGLREMNWDAPVFIVDPIDGTTNFIKNYCHSSISVALAEHGSVIAGVVYNPYLNDMFYAEKGKGAFWNGKPIRVSSELMQHGIAIFGSAPYYKKELVEPSFRLLRLVFDSCMDIRRSGSAALDLCYIATGRSEIYFEYRVSPWDFAAGSLIASEAGAQVSDLSGNLLRLNCKTSICATNIQNYPKFMELVRLAEQNL